MSEEVFTKCVEWNAMKDGSHECRCRLGLWAVSGPDLKTVTQEALRYWIQYYRDGEYKNHLSTTPERGEVGG